jgi:hypothetical protein
MQQKMILSLFTLIVSAGCTGGDATGAMSPDRASQSRAAASSSAQSSARSGQLIVRKECHLYTGQAGDICTITESNLEAIPVGSVITYASGAGTNGLLDTDVILDPPGPGNNVAFGHCSLSLVTGIGECRLTGGTGRFSKLNAQVAVSPLAPPDFAWQGTYSYSN